MSTKTEIISLEDIKVESLSELKGWRDYQNKTVKYYPFISIEDHKSYEGAKKHRTALVSARTKIQKQDRLIGSKLQELRNETVKISKELIAITQPHEEKQQKEVKRYEAEKEAKRLEEEKLEKERKAAIKKEINDLYETWKNEIHNIDQVKDVENTTEVMESRIAEQGQKDMEEFEAYFAEKVSLLRLQLEYFVQYLTEQEDARRESERVATERAAWEKEQAEARALAKKEEAAREVEEKKIQKQWEAEARELARQREAIEAEKSRIAEEERKRKEAIEAERKAREEAEARDKAESEEKAKQLAKKKRLKELKPDKEKLRK